MLSQVGKGGSKDDKHSYSAFASLEFEISNLTEEDVGGIKALKFNMAAEFMQGGSTSKVLVSFYDSVTVYTIYRAWL